MDLLTFDEIKNELEKSNYNHILLGNGYSIALNDKFNYNSLFEKAKEKLSSDSDKILQIFEKIGTTNFEACLKLLDDVQWIINLYGYKELEVLNTDSEKIKNSLIEVISEHHLSDTYQIAQVEKYNNYLFLSNFQNIFTLNYDLLLYWVLLDQVPIDYCDGFGKSGNSLIFKNNYKEKNYYYLHGALHLYRFEDELYKQCKTSVNNIMDEIKNSIGNKKYPMFVAEGDWQKKLNQIKNNAYLNYCYNQFNNIQGTLTIFGHSLNEHDKHILEAIKNNKNLTSIFISIKGSLSDTNNLLIQEIVDNNNLKNKTMYFDSETANIW